MVKEEKVVLIALDRLTPLQTRAGIREAAKLDYAELLRSGVKLDPATVYDVDGTLYNVDGVHRGESYRLAGMDKMPCVIRAGSLWSAIQAGIRANQRHVGERPSREDKRHAVKLVLQHQPTMTDRAIADLCGVSPTTVGSIRAVDCPIGQCSARVDKNGRAINTENIGRKPAPTGTQAQASDNGTAAPATDPPATPGEADNEARPLGADGDTDRCRCGSPWTSDGEGGRFCPECNATHPATSSIPFGADAALTTARPPSAPRDARPAPTAAEKLEHMTAAQAAGHFADFVEALGRAKRALDALNVAYPRAPDAMLHYRHALSRLDEAEDSATAWQREINCVATAVANGKVRIIP